MKDLKLPLKKKWFDMTKSGEKTEEYREITPYWCTRLLLFDGFKRSKDSWFDMLFDGEEELILTAITECYWTKFKSFNNNIITLGYPKNTDAEKIVTLENKGISIGTGKVEWGAEKDKMYFIIKHGAIVFPTSER